MPNLFVLWWYFLRWHLGSCHEDYLPTNRGFDTFNGHHQGWGHHYHHTHVTTGPTSKLQLYSFLIANWKTYCSWRRSRRIWLLPWDRDWYPGQQHILNCKKKLFRWKLFLWKCLSIFAGFLCYGGRTSHRWSRFQLLQAATVPVLRLHSTTYSPSGSTRTCQPGELFYWNIFVQLLLQYDTFLYLLKALYRCAKKVEG